MSLYKIYETDHESETKGILFEFPETFRMRIARASKSNAKYLRGLKKMGKKYRGVMDHFPDELENRAFIELYADTIILDWESYIDGEWQRGIEGPTGELLPFTRENVINTLHALPDFFRVLREEAESLANFSKDYIESSAKN